MKIHILDLNFQDRKNTIASYLVEGPTGLALIETGPMSTLDVLRKRIVDLGFTTNNIRHVFVTHIHLDHAGAAGWWAQQGAKIYVHHVGAPHLIDPSKLWESATRIYGDQMETLWGKNLPAPEESIIPLYDGDTVQVAGLTFTALDTPGHAYHHYVYCLEDVAFTGDAAGIRIPGSRMVDLPAPPPEFNREKWLETIDRLLQEPLSAIYPTHFGYVEDWRYQLQTLATLIEEATEFVRSQMEEGMGRDKILSKYLLWHQRRAEAVGLSDELFARYESANPHFMSVDGIMRYWRKRLKG